MNNLSFKSLFSILIVIVFTNCSVTQKIKKDLIKESKSKHFFRGFVVYDIKKNKEILNYNGNKYFTPASNTKLFTFYASFKTFKDSVVGLQYVKVKDSLFIKGSADPSFLYGFDESKTLDFLNRAQESIFLVDAQIDDNKFGDGWAWDDYAYNYMPEKNLFPIYGNLLRISQAEDSLLVVPQYFDNHIVRKEKTNVNRAYNSNQFYLNSYKFTKEKQIPFITSNKLLTNLLSDKLSKKITLINDDKDREFKPLYSVAYDSLYKKMLTISDNFIAEQLMLQVGYKTGNVYSVKSGIKYALDHYLTDIPQKPRWVDGSGLSRYNLFTPESFVFVLKKLYAEIPQKKLFLLMPAGGQEGTLKNYFSNSKPYIFAKTGTLSNNFNLSGYLITKKGTVLIFSFMNNHYKLRASDRKKEMEKYFLMLYNKY